MADTKITSYGQNGGITAGTVNVEGDHPPPVRTKPKERRWRTWVAWAIGTVGFLASLVAVLDYLEIHPWERTMREGKTSVTSYNQSGGITAGTVNIGPQPRRFTTADAKALAERIPAGSAVTVIAMGPDSEALAFAFEVYSWLKASGYPVKGPNEAWGRLPPIHGQAINKTNGGYEIVIGANRSVPE